MSTPSGREPGGPKRPDPDAAGADEFDDDRADTDPLPMMNLWSGGWGGSWSDSTPADRPVPPDRPRQPPPAEPPRGPRSERPVLGDVDLPPPPEPFAFPTTAPRQSRAGRNRAVLAGVGAAAVLAVIGGLAVWLTSGSDSDNAAEPGAVTTTAGTGQQQAAGRDAAAEARLMRALPPGYPPGVCKPTDPVSGAVATVKCDGNADPGGPTSATFMLARDKAALDALFAGLVAPGEVVICPGNIQSPGAWRRNASPQQVSGTLVCAMQGNAATVGWTDEARLLVSVVRSSPPGPTLDQLYQWWSSHS